MAAAMATMKNRASRSVMSGSRPLSSPLATVRTRTARAVAAVLALLGTALPTLAFHQAAGAQTSPSEWTYFDNPDLQGPSEYWYDGQTGKGYGANNYRFTYAIGGDADAVNSAVWSLRNRVGTQELQVFVPCNHAVATVTYEVRGSDSPREVEVNQLEECGHTAWTSLGQFAFDDGSASVVLRDNNSAQHYRRVEFWRSQFGVDAIRARCVSNCAIVDPVGVPAAPTNLTAMFSECDDYERGCVRFTWTPPSLADGSPYTGYTYVLSRAGRKWEGAQQPTSHRLTDALYDTTYTFEISAVNGTKEGPAARVPITTPPEERTGGPPYISSAQQREYPDGEGCGGTDNETLFYMGQCTAYVAWRLNDAGINFHNTKYRNGGSTPLPVVRGHRRWGHAKSWANAAATVGIVVNSNPAPGSVAQWSYGWSPNDESRCPDPRYENDLLGCHGHVAYVESVSADGNQITITEMNFAGPACSYGTRMLTRGQPNWPQNFIHFERANP